MKKYTKKNSNHIENLIENLILYKKHKLLITSLSKNLSKK